MMPVRRRVITSPWERAYLGFETSQEEEGKFVRRLLSLGAMEWNRDSLVLDLFCGRGGGTRALRRLGFRRIVGVDLSPKLQSTNAHENRAVADCRVLPVLSESVDIAIVQGGLHHLPSGMSDLSATLREVSRILRPSGLFVLVEPWRTLFLDAVHWVCRSALARRLMRKIDALATMIEHERATYETWLESGPAILEQLDNHFERRRLRIRWGKVHYVGERRAGRVLPLYGAEIARRQLA